jgi:four helix bundle protein
MRNFRNYDVWVDGVEFSIDIYKMTEDFPKKETYALCDQMQRAAVSIPSNIAEGCSRKSVNEFAHFLEFSLGSSYEIETQLEIAVRLGYVQNADFEKAIEKVQSIEKRITGLIQTIRPNGIND